MSLAPRAADDRIAAVRRFNRFYTGQIGVLDEKLLDSRFSLTEVRLLYEIVHRNLPTAAELARDLGLDQGYVSRILRKFGKESLVTRRPSGTDGRQSHLELTAKGRKTVAVLEARSNGDVGSALGKLSDIEQRQLLTAMHVIERVLGGRKEPKEPYVLRPPEPGDMGWVVNRHGALYARDYGYDEHFESLVASVVAEFVEKFDARRERCWIAERDGEAVGSVFVIRKSEKVARLRMLIVEPSARGLGIGRRLVDECVRFARSRGYRMLTLWTHSQLVAARRLYEEAGFKLVAAKPGHSFGKDLVDETWNLVL